ncbi:MAG: phage tail length tape measure family protein [Salipiger marinus]|uniref:phage tail length tape measure family protein n=1 Tax=Salipiger marinus TaxID=555512 RepID=UPI004058D60F
MAFRFAAFLDLKGAREAARELRGTSEATEDLAQATRELDRATVDLGAGTEATEGALDGLGQGAREAAGDLGAAEAAADRLTVTTRGLDARTGATGQALRETGREAARTGGILDRLRGGFDRVRQVGVDAFTRLRGGAQGAGDSTQIAAGTVGNLTSQLFDIGVMLQAGQNPLVLATQQGSQIAQVLGPMGARGAVIGLGRAFLSLLSPVTLITMGTIAAGAAMTSWLTSASEEAQSLDDVLQGLGESIDGFRDLSDMSLADMRARWGTVTEEVRQLHREMQAAARDQMMAEATTSVRTLQEDMAPREVREMFGGSTRKFSRTGRDQSYDQIVDRLSIVGSAASIEEQIDALRDMQALLRSNVGGSAEQVSQQKALLATTNEVLDRLLQVKAASEAIPQSIRDQADAAAQAYLARQQELETARQMLVDQQEQNALQAAALRFGEDSVDYAEAQAEASRRALEARLEELPVAEDLKDQIREALELNIRLSQIDIASGIRDGANAASVLAGNLSAAIAELDTLRARATAAAGERARRAQIRLDTVGDPVARAGAMAVQDLREELPMGGYPMIPSKEAAALKAAEDQVRRRAEEAAALEEQADAADAAWRKLQAGLNGGGRSGGGSRARRQERDGVADLIATQRAELEILRELDPVQKELIRNREVLAEATEAERQAVAEIIAERQAEQAAVSLAREQYDAFRSVGFDAITGLARGGDEAAAAISRLGDAIYDAAMKALLLGEGPLAGLLGGGEGGLLGMLFSAIAPGSPAAPAGAGAGAIPANADGGMQYFPGGSRADKGLSWLSSGEFVVNANATARHRALLEAINAGGMPPLAAFAQGGAVGSAGAAMLPQMPQITFIDQSGRGVDVKSEERLEGGRRQMRFVLSDAVADAMTTPGGRARSTLAGMGARPQRPGR